MAQPPPPTVAGKVEEWIRRSEWAWRYKDCVHMSAVSTAFSALAAVHMGGVDPKHTQLALTNFHIYLYCSRQVDQEKDEGKRDLMHDLLYALLFTLDKLTEERNQVKETVEINTQTEEEPTQHLPEPSLSSENSPNEPPNSNDSDEEFIDVEDNPLDRTLPFIDGRGVEQLVENYSVEEREEKEEEKKTVESSTQTKDGSLSGESEREKKKKFVDSSTQVPKNGEFERKEKKTVDSCTQTKNHSTTGESERKRRHSKSKHRKYAESESESDSEYDRPSKKSRSGSSKKRSRENSKHKSVTPLRKLKEKNEKKTPRCVYCDKYPQNVANYIKHLKCVHDKSTLKENGIYLMCACGTKLTSDSKRLNDHNKECDGAPFTLHRIKEE